MIEKFKNIMFNDFTLLTKINEIIDKINELEEKIISIEKIIKNEDDGK